MNEERLVELLEKNNKLLEERTKELLEKNNKLLEKRTKDLLEKNNNKLILQMNALGEKIDKVETNVNKRIDEIETKINKRIDGVEARHDIESNKLYEKIVDMGFYFEEEYGTKISAIFDKLQLNDQMQSKEKKKIDRYIKHNDALLISHDIRITKLEEAVSSE